MLRRILFDIEKKRGLTGEVKQKLNSNKGESIAETLIALLVSTLALVMLAGAISSAGNVVEKGRKAMKEYYDGIENVVKRDGTGESVSMTLLDQEGNSIYLFGSSSTAITVNAYSNSRFQKYPVVAYKYRGGSSEPSTEGGTEP